MLKIWFNEYKWIAVALLFLVYSVGVWNVSSDVQQNSFNKERLAQAQEIIKVQKENLALSSQLAQSLQARLTAEATSNAAFTKGLIDEIAKDPRFKQCRTTDGVRAALQRKIDGQAR